MQPPIVSIVVALYQIEDLLPRFLASLSAILRSDLRVEAILVDDGSTDNTLRLAQDFEKVHDNALTIAHTTNQGLFRARQTGVGACSGQFVWLVDGDDILMRLNLDFIAQSLASLPAVDLFSFGYIETRDLAYEPPKINSAVKYKTVVEGCVLFPFLYWGNIWRYIVRRTLLLKYYNQTKMRHDMGEDLILTSWLGANAGAAMLADSPVYVYRKHRPGSYTEKLPPLHRIEASVELFFEICVRNLNNLDPVTRSMQALFSLNMREDQRIECERSRRVDLVEKCLAIDDLAFTICPSQAELAALIEHHSIGLRPNAANERAGRILACMTRDKAA